MSVPCDINNPALPSVYVSSNGYYGYVPKVHEFSPTVVDHDHRYYSSRPENSMEVDENYFDQYNNNNSENYHNGHRTLEINERYPGFNEHRLLLGITRKRSLDNKDECMAYSPRLKRIKEGNSRAESGNWFSGMAQMRHKAPLLCLSAITADSRANVRPNQSFSEVDNKSFEEMLMQTHGCSSYHKHLTLWRNDRSLDEAEF